MGLYIYIWRTMTAKNWSKITEREFRRLKFGDVVQAKGSRTFLVIGDGPRAMRIDDGASPFGNTRGGIIWSLNWIDRSNHWKRLA